MATKKTTNRRNSLPKETASSQERSFCGLIMPISELDGMPATHWVDVRKILEEAASLAGFRARMVSDSDETSIIHKSIIQNLYTDKIAICDVSGLNPNVMFELGMRLAFDKPTVVIKDDVTRFSFDTSPMQHITYRRDLRFQDVRDFIEELKNKIMSTCTAAKEDPNYSPFLKSFGSFKLPEMPTETVGIGEYTAEQLQRLDKSVTRLSAKISDMEVSLMEANPNIFLSSRFNRQPQNAFSLTTTKPPSPYDAAITTLGGIKSIDTSIP